MLPDRVSNPGPMTYKSGALPIALRSPAGTNAVIVKRVHCNALMRSFFPKKSVYAITFIII